MFNSSFDLTIRDVELIEDALQIKKSAVSASIIKAQQPGYEPAEDSPTPEAMNATLTDIHELLGRLHNQKVFYRPSDEPYVSG